MNDYIKLIKLDDAISVCREKQIIEGDFVTGVRFPRPDEIINDLYDLPTIEVQEYVNKEEAFMNGYAKGSIEGYVKGVENIEVSEDCIERDFIISQLLNLMSVEKEHYEGMDKALKLIEHAPRVVPNRAEGEWQNTIGGIYMCSNCKSSFTNIPKDGYWKPMWNYCPNCGAKMKG